MKYIQFETNAGTYRVPLEAVAKHRADYYLSKEGEECNYQEEIDFIMNDDFEGIDWMMNNTDFKDFKGVVEFVEKSPVYSIEYDMDSEPEIIEA